MKILVICHEFPPLVGGGGKVAYLVSKELSRENQVDVITPYYPKLKRNEKIGNIEIFRVKVFGRVNVEFQPHRLFIIPFLSFIFVGILKGIFLSIKNKYDVIHSHFVIPSGLIGMIVSFLTKIPHVTTLYEADVFDPRFQCLVTYKSIFIKCAIYFVIKFSKKVTSISSYIAEATKKFYLSPFGEKNKQISVINPGIDLVKCDRKKEKADFRFNHNDFILISIGRLVKRKNFGDLIEVMRQINNENIKLVIIGDGPEYSILKEKVEKLGLQERIFFLNNLSDEEKYEYLSVSNVFVSTTLHEGFGLVYLEAMNFGLPIVTTNEGGQTDLITDGENGFLVSVGDIKNFVEKIMLLYNNKDLYEKIKLNNLEKIKSFSIKATAEKYIKLFKE